MRYLMLALLITGCSKFKPNCTPTPEGIFEASSDKAVGPFQVSGARIYNGLNERFVVKGASMFDYIYDQDQYPDRRVHMETAKAMGLNTIRVNWRSTAAISLTRLDEIVQLGQELEMVVVIQNIASTPIKEQEFDFVRKLAKRYKNFNHVWMVAANEINCQGGDLCHNPVAWERDTKRLLSNIRATGFTNPVIVQGIAGGGQYAGGSWGFNKSIADYLPPESDPNLVLGVHRYADKEPELNECGEYVSWAVMTKQYAMVMDELGYSNNFGQGFIPPQPTWSVQMMNFINHWSSNLGGSGVIGFTWYDSYCHPDFQENCLVYEDFTLTNWGRIFGLKENI